MNNIYELKLHEGMVINDRDFVMRVPGGWLYTVSASDTSSVSVYVPFDNEFMQTSESMESKPSAAGQDSSPVSGAKVE